MCVGRGVHERGSSDELSLTCYVRFVYEFIRSWERFGPARGQASRPRLRRVLGGAAYPSNRPSLAFSTTFEVDNISDAQVLNHYGVQRMGHTVSVKLAVSY